MIFKPWYGSCLRAVKLCLGMLDAGCFATQSVAVWISKETLGTRKWVTSHCIPRYYWCVFQLQEKRAFILQSIISQFEAKKAQENSMRKSKQGYTIRFYFSGDACYSFTKESLRLAISSPVQRANAVAPLYSLRLFTALFRTQVDSCSEA